MSCEPLLIRRGKTFILPLRLASKPFIYKAITGITQADPARVTAVDHGLVDGWPVAVVGVKGMRQINAQDFDADGWPAQVYPATVVDDDHVELNDVRASGFSAYASGGSLMYASPVDLANYVAVRMQVKDEIDGTVLATFTLADGDFTIDLDLKKLTLEISADDTAGFEWDEGITDIELEDTEGRVSDALGGPRRVQVLPEVTTE